MNTHSPSLVALLFGLAVALLPASSARAQSPDAVREGQRIRVHYNATGSGVRDPAVGQFLRAGADSVTLLGEYGRLSIPASSIARIERFAGTKSHTLAGALIGGGLCTALVLMAEDASNDEPLAVNDEGLETAAAVLVISLGTLSGAFIGHLAKTEQWEPAAIPATVGVAPATDGGVRITAHFSF